jgi:hypothetical protein
MKVWLTPSKITGRSSPEREAHRNKKFRTYDMEMSISYQTV